MSRLRIYTIEELKGFTITDLKATGLYPRGCNLCGKKIEGVVYRVSLHHFGPSVESDVSVEIYTHEECYTELRKACEVNGFAQVFGA